MCEYPITYRTAGEEGSSTYEGRHLTFVESDLVHPYHADGLVDKGDPVLVGDNIVGVAFKSAAAATDLIAVDTEGIWYLNVLGCVTLDGTAAGIAHAGVAGDPIYFQKVPSTDMYLLSGENDSANRVPFGFLLGATTGSTTVPTLVAVKVHMDGGSILNNGIDSAPITVATTRFGSQYATTMGSGHTEGLIRYSTGNITGTTNGHTYGVSEWINSGDAAVLTAGNIVVPHDTGVYSGVAQAAARIVFGSQHMAILAGAPASLHAWRLNTATYAVTALIAAASPQSVGWVAGAGTAGAQVGYIPIADIVGPGIVYVRCYSSAT